MERGARHLCLSIRTIRGRSITKVPDVTDLKCLRDFESRVAETGTEWDLEVLVKEVKLCLVDTNDRDSSDFF